MNVAMVATLKTNPTPVETTPLAVPMSLSDHWLRNSFTVTAASLEAWALTMWIPNVSDVQRSRLVSHSVPFWPTCWASWVMAGISTRVSSTRTRMPTM